MAPELPKDAALSARPDLAKLPGVHAMTDVTGFGLLGHLLEMCRGSGVGARVNMAKVPLLDQVLAMADAGLVTGASGRNWRSYGGEVDLAGRVTDAQRALLSDPQTSGGLLVACAADALADVMATFARHGGARASLIGSMTAGAPRISVEI
jgi:selenide, water dikinase